MSDASLVFQKRFPDAVNFLGHVHSPQPKATQTLVLKSWVLNLKGKNYKIYVQQKDADSEPDQTASIFFKGLFSIKYLIYLMFYVDSDIKIYSLAESKSEHLG